MPSVWYYPTSPDEVCATWHVLRKSDTDVTSNVLAKDDTSGLDDHLFLMCLEFLQNVLYLRFILVFLRINNLWNYD